MEPNRYYCETCGHSQKGEGPHVYCQKCHARMLSDGEMRDRYEDSDVEWPRTWGDL